MKQKSNFPADNSLVVKAKGVGGGNVGTLCSVLLETYSCSQTQSSLISKNSGTWIIWLDHSTCFVPLSINWSKYLLAIYQSCHCTLKFNIHNIFLSNWHINRKTMIKTGTQMRDSLWGQFHWVFSMPLVRNILTLIKVSLATSEQTASPSEDWTECLIFAVLLTGGVIGKTWRFAKGDPLGKLKDAEVWKWIHLFVKFFFEAADGAGTWW